MRILIVGGSAFVGRHITQAALDAGHDVTLFNRGQTGPALFPSAEHLTGDRNADLSALADSQWDATIDVCAYVPRQVSTLAEALDGRGGQHLFISTVSVYQAPVQPGYTEDAPLARLSDPATEEVTDQTYGGLKVLCEQAVTELYGKAGTTIVRPTYVIGPHDRTYRFTWWVDRIARGGEVLAPGEPDDPMQVIDARDLATWSVALVENSVSGTFHAASPAPPFGFGQLLETVAAEVAPPGTTLTWVDSGFLRAEGEDGASLPLWSEGDSADATILTASPAAAIGSGLLARPLRQTVASVAAEVRADGSGRPGIGLTGVRETELLAAWRRLAH
jgi:2'-hydroxyisoflavone reductase